jgi:hypothetical protein
VVHGAAGRLFAVAEGGVEDDELGIGSHRLKTFPSRQDHNVPLCSEPDVLCILMML